MLHPWRIRPAILIGLTLLANCTTSPGSTLSNLTEEGRLLNYGPPARLNAAAVTQRDADSVPLLFAFAVEAGEIRSTVPPLTDLASQQQSLAGVTDWGDVTLAGEAYVDTQCYAFLSALDALERQKRATLANLNAIQSATVGIMGLALAAQRAIGIVGIAFGLAASLFDNTVSSVLYQLPAASIRSIVLAQRDLLRQREGEILPKITNRGLADARIAEYVQYCVPVAIEANVATVLSNAKSNPGANSGAGAITSDGAQPAVTSALAPVISGNHSNTVEIPFTPATANSGRAVSTEVQRRRIALVDDINAITDRAILDALAMRLGIPDEPGLAPLVLKGRIRATIAARVSSPDPVGEQQMDAMSQLLAPLLGKTF